MRTKRFIAVFVILLWSELLYGKFAMPESVPAGRLIENMKAYLKDHPKDNEAYYNLARVHYIAFINKSLEVGVFKDEPFSRVVPDWRLQSYNYYIYSRNEVEKLVLKKYGFKSMAEVPDTEARKIYQETNETLKQLQQQGWKPPPTINDEQIIMHVIEATANFEKAIELEKNNSLYYLGLASFYEQFISYRDNLPKDSNSKSQIPENLKQVTYQNVADAYLKSYQLSIQKDLRLKNLPVSGLRSIIGYEAGNGYIRVIKNLPQPTKQEKQTAQEMAKNISKFEKLPIGAITPIIFSLKKKDKLSDLVLPEQKVKFDLDGSGRMQNWQWIKPSTAFLVWDPDNTGKITSGRQMFGSVTWWIFFSNGYRALDALDNNRDGQLSDAELVGLSAWFDLNSNGISEKGEVIPIEKLGVDSISTLASSANSELLMNRQGIKLKDGRVCATFDWIASPAR